MADRLLVTSALPYSNGSIHIGHLVEYLQTDIFCRHQRMAGKDVAYVCADDTHGTPIMIRARRDGIDPVELVERAREEHILDFEAFGIEFSEYHQTNSETNRELVLEIFEALRERGDVEAREIEQFYCENDGFFLPDRLIRGTCPNPDCGADDQYGDQCEVCGRTHQPTDLVEPRCAECGEVPVVRETEHLFFLLNRYEEWLDDWTGEHLQDDVARYVSHWIEGGLRDWDITRDDPYFGFEIPGREDQYFYVWFDAPVGYVAATKAWCERTGRDFDAYWRRSDEVEVIHFIGKDILYFHTLFWPAMLKGAGFNIPSHVYVHGFLTVDGERMSKSRGTFINARTYLDHLEPELLRYYYASKLGPHVADIDLDLDDFIHRVNADLVGKLANLAARIAPFVEEGGGRLTTVPDDALPLLADVRERVAEVRALYDDLEYGKAIRAILEITAVANGYVEERAPWEDRKAGNHDRALASCTAAANFLVVIAGLLRPVIPTFAARVDEYLGLDEPATYEDLADDENLEDQPVRPYERLAERIDRDDVDRLIEASRREQAAFDAGDAEDEDEGTTEVTDDREPIEDEISFDEFRTVDIRVARVVEASHVEGADRLLRLEVDIGGGDVRQVLAGIKERYDPADLEGRTVLVCANLAPREMSFGTSEAMVLAAGEGGRDIHLATVEEGAEPGDRIH